MTIKAKRRQDLETAYRLYRDMLFRIAIVYMKNTYDAEDCVQDAFIRLMQYTKPFDSEEHRKAWLIVVVSNICKDRFRAKSSQDVSYDELEPFLAETRSTSPRQNELLDLVLKLPQRLITPVYMHYYEGYKTGEIAEVLERNPSTVRNQLAEARKLLKIEIESEVR